MLDSEPTDTTNDAASNDAASNDAASNDAPSNNAASNDAPSTEAGAPAPRKRAPRKAAKKAAAPAGEAAGDPTTAADPSAPQTSPAQPTGGDAPVKATRRRRATAPAGEPSAEEQPTVPASPPVAAMAAPFVAAGSPEAAGSSTEATTPPRTRRRSTKASGPVVADTLTDSLTDSTAADTGASAAADTETAPRRRSRRSAAAADASGSATPESDATSNDAPAEDAPARTPRKRGARKAAAPAAVTFEPSNATDEVRPDDAPTTPDLDAAPPARPAIPVLFVAPGTVEPEAPPAARRRRRATSAVSTPATSSPVEPITGADEPSDVADPARADDAEVEAQTETQADESASGDDDAGRRRRRRGRRGRGARSEDGDNADDADGVTDTDTDTTDDSDGDATDDDEAAEGTGSRRRRRRRRGSSADGDNRTDDPPNTVVHVRNQRSSRSNAGNSNAGNSNAGNSNAGNSNATPSSDDEVRGIRGSSRLEAKRQRRREGRDNGRRRVPILTESEFLARRESVDRLMAVRQRGDRTQIAILEDGVLVEHYVTRASATSYVGNVYLGRVQNVLPSMEAAFVDIGKGRNGVLYAGEVNWDAAGLEGKARAIEAAMKSGDAVLVQVTKDPIGHKGARLTSQISLPGRFLVLVPNGGMTGISRKLPDTERHRLKAILKKIVPEDAGVIVRTAAEGASEEDLTSDMDRLKSQWEAISAHAAKPGDAPVLVHGEPDLAIRVVRDVFNEDFQSMVVEGDSAWDEIGGYLGSVAPELAARASRHTGDTDLFHDLRVDEQLAKALDRKVWLPSGGSLVIDRTEAMVVIDVNTGKFTGSGGNLEQTVTRNNLEAAEEIVRQLRLRDVGGIIVIDFIDMVLESNRELVLRRLTECLGRDRTKHQVAEVTSLGLVQMTRKRVGEGLLEAFSEPCDKCQGRGVIVHSEPIDQPHEHDIDDGPSRGSGRGASGNGSGNGAGNGSARRNRRGRGGQRDDVPVVEEHEDDPERRARAAAAMNAIARHSLSAEAEAAADADVDLMPGGVLDPDAVYAAEQDSSDDDAAPTDDVDPDQLADEIEAALDELPSALIDAALDASAGEPDDESTAEASTDLTEPDQPQSDRDADGPASDAEESYAAGSHAAGSDAAGSQAAGSDAAGSDAGGSDAPEAGSSEPGPVPLEGGETADETDHNPLPAQAEPDAPSASNGRPRRRRAARRPAGPPVHA